MARFIIKLINVYQKLASPDHSAWGQSRFPHGYCQYYPSCSEYAKQSFEQFGFWLGALKATTRILRCNPFSKGGIDLVKINHKS